MTPVYREYTMAAGETPTTDIQPGDVTTSARVTVAFEIM